MLIKQFFKYVIKTDWQKIRSDYSRFRYLVAACREMNKDLNQERQSVIQLIPQFSYLRDNDTKKACLNYMYNLPGISDNVNFTEVPCKEFDTNKQCKNSNCEFYHQNNSYIIFLKQYQYVLNQKNTFWAEKFANVK